MAKTTPSEGLRNVAEAISDLSEELACVVHQAQKKDWKRVSLGLALMTNNLVAIGQMVDQLTRSDARSKGQEEPPEKTK